MKKFKQLARLCPNLVTPERDKVKKMLKMFRSDLAVMINSGSYLSMIVANCVSRAIRAEYWVRQDREHRVQFYKAKKEERVQAK